MFSWALGTAGLNILNLPSACLSFVQDILQAIFHIPSMGVMHFTALNFKRSPTISLSISVGNALFVPHQSLHSAFSHYATKFPRCVALEHLGTILTYEALDGLSTQMAHRLSIRGVGPGSRVLLLAHRSIEMIVGLIAILKSGASYIPLDGGIVTDRTLEAVILDSCPALMLCSKKYQHRLRSYDIPVIELSGIANLKQSFPDHPLVLQHSLPSDEAYVIYTSGTTGQPKGVSVSHANVTNLICTSPGNLGIRPGVRVSQLLNIAFDMCAWEILACLANGGTLVLRGSTCFEWEDVLKSVQVVIATPSILAKFQPSDYPNVQTIASAGEPCPQRLADEWAVGRKFFNCCGPTEVTIVNTMHLHTVQMPIAIGSPTPNNAMYVLDENLKPVPIGIPGMLWAGGAGICRGYVNRPSLTESKFKPDPFLPRSHMYNTGDIGRLRADGVFEHLGRLDDQVKIKGFRVELDGVAAAILTRPGISLAAVLYHKGELWAFYSPCEIPENVVRSTVASIQPYYSVPTRYLAFEKLPLTSNGKIDKTFLRQKLEHQEIPVS